jgi:hypothetical protein
MVGAPLPWLWFKMTIFPVLLTCIPPGYCNRLPVVNGLTALPPIPPMTSPASNVPLHAGRSVYLDDAGLLAEPKSTIDSQQVVGATACRNDEVATPLVRSP